MSRANVNNYDSMRCG